MPGRHNVDRSAEGRVEPATRASRPRFTDLDTDLDLEADPTPPTPPPAFIVISVPRLSLRCPEWLRAVGRRTGVAGVVARSRAHPPRPGVAATAALGVLVLALAADSSLTGYHSRPTADPSSVLTDSPSNPDDGTVLPQDPDATAGGARPPSPNESLLPTGIPTAAPAVMPGPALSPVPLAAPPAALPVTPRTGQTGAPKQLSDSGIPARVKTAYVTAAKQESARDPNCGVTWTLLAAIGRVESNHGRANGSTVNGVGVAVPPILGVVLDGSTAGTGVVKDTDQGVLDGNTSYDRAVGPMQFLPLTWRLYAADGDGDKVANPQDIDDAALTAARYLCSTRPPSGTTTSLATAAGQWAAAYRYNHSTAYANLVLALATTYATGTPTAVTTPPPGATTSVVTTTTTITPAPATTTTTSTTTTTPPTSTVTVTVTATATATATSSTATSSTTTSSTTSSSTTSSSTTSG
ncbi:MAG TPA: lytic transglycosylase domain-containing protein [Kineosporiaceae bacterium]